MELLDENDGSVRLVHAYLVQIVFEMIIVSTWTRTGKSWKDGRAFSSAGILSRELYPTILVKSGILTLDNWTKITAERIVKTIEIWHHTLNKK